MKNGELLFGLMAAFNKDKYAFEDLAHLSKPFGLSETILRTTLSRLYKADKICIKKNGREAFYSFSFKGIQNSLNVAYSFKNPDWKRWDNTWWGISYSLPNKADKERYRLTKKMRSYRFALFNAGFWIRPYNKNEQVDIAFSNSVENNYFKLIRFQPVKPFTRIEILDAWKIMNVHHSFNDATSMLVNKFKELETLSPEQALYEKMITGEMVVSTLFNDPLLPPEYLPKNWKGNELRQQFRIWDKKATEISKPYWKKILN